jgi:hypothetical protein
MDYWTIRIDDAALQWHTFMLQTKDGCYVSANTKLVASDKAVRILDEELAVRFREAIMPIMRRRHGEDVRLTIEERGTSKWGKAKQKPFDDALVQARIEQNNFAPNKRPSGV